jgi:hypothetical protein
VVGAETPDGGIEGGAGELFVEGEGLGAGDADGSLGGEGGDERGESEEQDGEAG